MSNAYAVTVSTVGQLLRPLKVPGDHHACVACLTGYYADERHVCTTFCGKDLEDRTIKAVVGAEYMGSCDCSSCLVAFDAWAQSKTQAEVEWER